MDEEGRVSGGVSSPRVSEPPSFPSDATSNPLHGTSDDSFEDSVSPSCDAMPVLSASPSYTAASPGYETPEEDDGGHAGAGGGGLEAVAGHASEDLAPSFGHPSAASGSDPEVTGSGALVVCLTGIFILQPMK